MQRRVLGMVAAICLVLAASGCTASEVQVWFRVHLHRSLSARQAGSIADSINRHLPVGSVDLLGQVLTHIEVSGWAYDPDTTSSINVDVYDGSTGQRIQATYPRADLSSIAPGGSIAHGFHVSLAASPGVHHVCVHAINDVAGLNPLLGCRDVDVLAPADVTAGGVEVKGLLEGVDAIGDLVHVRGYVSASDPATRFVLSTDAGAPTGYVEITGQVDVTRPDVHAIDPAAPVASGFDFSLGPFTTSSHTFTGYCLGFLSSGASVVTNVMCRDAGT